MKCTSNNAVALFENIFTIAQPLLDCSNLLVLKAGAPSSISIPYVDGGADLSKSHLDFFDLTPTAGCTYSCNYGDSCGPSTTITSTNVAKTSVSPFQITYN